MDFKKKKLKAWLSELMQLSVSLWAISDCVRKKGVHLEC